MMNQLLGILDDFGVSPLEEASMMAHQRLALGPLRSAKDPSLSGKKKELTGFETSLFLGILKGGNGEVSIFQNGDVTMNNDNLTWFNQQKLGFQP